MSNAKSTAAKMIEDSSEWRKEREISAFQLGSKMRHYRIKSGKSLRSVATAIGFTAPYLSDCERGFRKLSENNLKKFIEACDAPKEAVKK